MQYRLLLTAVATTALAARGSLVPASSQQTLTIPFYGYDNQAIVASVIAANDDTTTLSLACPSGTDSNDCGLFPSEQLTIGAGMYRLDMSADGFTGFQDCNTAKAVCTNSAGGSEANAPGLVTMTYTEDVISIPVTVTAGGEKLAASTGSSTPTITSALSTHSTDTSGSGSETSANRSSSAGASGPSSTGAARHNAVADLGLIIVGGLMAAMNV